MALQFHRSTELSYFRCIDLDGVLGQFGSSTFHFSRWSGVHEMLSADVERKFELLFAPKGI